MKTYVIFEYYFYFFLKRMLQPQQVDNSRIINVLSYLVTERLLSDNNDSANAIRRAIDNISSCGFQIYDVSQADNISGVGKKIHFYIQSILQNTDSSKCGIPEIDRMPYEQKLRLVTITEMDKIPDIGVKRASMYYDAGYNTVDKLKEFLITSGSQRTQAAIQHENHLNKRIPRDKITLFLQNFDAALQVYNSSTGSSLNRDVGGSYIRNKPDSGDIDILLWSFSPKEVTTKVPHFLEYLRQNNLLLNTQVSGSIIYQGIAYIDTEYPSVRIDIKSLPDLSNYHYATLHLIGSGSFNIRMSDIARSKGWTLGSNGMTITATKEPIYVRSQEDIFTLLGIPYVNYEDR